MPPNPLAAIAAAALVAMGYVREWGEPGGLQLFMKYEDAGSQPVVLQDTESVTAEDIADSLEEQGVDMTAFFAAIERLDEQP